MRLSLDENEERVDTWAVAGIPCWYDSYLNKLAIFYTEIRLLVFILFDCRDIWNSPRSSCHSYTCIEAGAIPPNLPRRRKVREIYFLNAQLFLALRERHE